VNKDGDGTWVLTGANTYTGSTVVSEGTLLVNNGSGSGTGTGTVSSFINACMSMNNAAVMIMASAPATRKRSNPDRGCADPEAGVVAAGELEVISILPCLEGRPAARP
jgi:autotransporter-associated beta strand protein